MGVVGGVRLRYRFAHRKMPSPVELFSQALRRRDPLRADRRTDALRLLDGVGDGAGFDGLFIDDFAGRWMVNTARPGQQPPEWLRALPAADAPVSMYWKALDSRDQRPPLHWAGAPVGEPFTAREHGISYRIDFGAGYSQGIFLDQRDNRLALRGRVRPGGAVLNCFAYTCAFSVVAAMAGARTASVDLSRRSLDWGRENFRLNGLDTSAEAGHDFLAGDTFEWLRRFARQGRRFDGVVLDPPTFSRDRRGKVFRVEDDFGALVGLAAALLAPGGWMLCSTNARTLTAASFRRRIADGLPGGPSAWRLEPAPMPPDFTGEHYLQTVWVLG